ncbi:uncharacterized protein LOC143361099 [Halictus rubicundus]|uniref:uncharacterized protein LOC143361099 n=1 Tax=Halictus rubicundus TaxID=77578 RepID=UPI004035ADD5
MEDPVVPRSRLLRRSSWEAAQRAQTSIRKNNIFRAPLITTLRETVEKHGAPLVEVSGTGQRNFAKLMKWPKIAFLLTFLPVVSRQPCREPLAAVATTFIQHLTTINFHYFFLGTHLPCGKKELGVLCLL